METIKCRSIKHPKWSKAKHHVWPLVSLIALITEVRLVILKGKRDKRTANSHESESHIKDKWRGRVVSLSVEQQGRSQRTILLPTAVDAAVWVRAKRKIVTENELERISCCWNCGWLCVRTRFFNLNTMKYCHQVDRSQKVSFKQLSLNEKQASDSVRCQCKSGCSGWY